MLKRFLYIILLSHLLVIGCSSFTNLGMDQASIDNVRKAQEIAKISKDIYDIQHIIKTEDVNISTMSEKFKVFGIKEYLTMAELVTDLKSISNSLDDEDVSLSELEEYSELTGLLVNFLTPEKSEIRGIRERVNYTVEGNLLYPPQANKAKKVVTLAEVNAQDNDSIEDFELPKNTLLLSKLDLIDSLYYYNQKLYTGIAYSSFDNGQISEFKTMKDGFLSGPVYAWYEDGSYAMQANFLDGYLTGRFLAWSEVGDVIYDIYFNKGQFNSDLQYERDTAREDQEVDSAEGESDSEGNSGE